MNNVCHACNTESLVTVKAEFYTVRQDRDPEMVEQVLCLPCLLDTADYIADCEGRGKERRH